MEMRSPALSDGALAPDALRRRCDPARLGFATTAELEDIDAVVGQARALDALEFGLGMRREGYNLFAMGPEGSGRHTLVRRRLEQQAAALEPPADWCYVFNFDAPHKPWALRFPAGQAVAFRSAMERLVEDLSAAVPSAFETDEYRHRRNEIEKELGDRQGQAMGELGERARAQGIALIRTPGGFAFGPMRGDEVMKPEEFQALSEDEQKQLSERVSAFQEQLGNLLQEFPKWRREAQRKLRALNRDVAGTAIGSLIEELQAEYRSVPRVAEYLGRMREDMLENAEAFYHAKEGEAPTLFGSPLALPEPSEAPLRRYAVNVLIEHSGAKGAPVVHEDNPAHDALLGRIEHISQMGALFTDFTLIKAGALHRANGGYLILDALKVLGQPFAWDALKRALRSREIRTQSLGQALGLVSTVSLEPEPIALEVKVVLLGERLLYYLLHAYDPEFAELFKVAVDFEEDVSRSEESDCLAARIIATFARREGLRPLDAAAVAAVIDQQSREAGDAGKLSTSMQALVDLLRESDYWAGEAKRGQVGAADVRRAIDTRVQRSDRVRQKLLEDVVRGSRLVDTDGARIGQANGLAVLQLGDASFGMAQRITARVRLGAGRVVDIERESQLGGPVHSKGVLILGGFLAGRFAANKPLSLSATLVFEQSYGGVEGDSASSAELYALLSALADAPLRQSMAVTGSVNQHGDIQAVGGVNEKIEGFFDLCASRGLTGGQGVLIPESNVKNLMLREDVVQAVADGRFGIYPVRSVDEGIARLAGLPAEAVYARVEQRLSDYAERARAYISQDARKPWRAKPPQK